MARDTGDILARASELKNDHSASLASRSRVKAIMNGGVGAIAALLGSHVTDPDLPWANVMLSGLTRLAQKISHLPTIRADVPNQKDSERARKLAEKRERIVEAYDLDDRLELQLPQMSRWVPGYGFGVWTIATRTSADGIPYPHAELRDPYDAYPSAWGVEQQPEELAIWRRISIPAAKRLYPDFAPLIDGLGRGGGRGRGTGGAVILGDGGKWANPSGRGIAVVEFYDADGIHTLLPEIEKRVAFTPNLLDTGPAFVVPKRFAFDQLTGQYDHVIGLMAAMAKINILSIIAIQDGVFVEALALDTPLPTPTGWTTMGEVGVGDLLFGVDGLPVEVTQATDVQQDRVCYEVTFEDGTSVVASDGHLWTVKVVGQRHPAKVRTTQEIVDDGRRFRVPASKPWKLPEVDLPIDPYVLGLWLGDGSAANAIITSGAADVAETERNIRQQGFTTKRVSTRPDRAEMTYISEPGAGRRGTGLHGKLRLQRLMRNKHVPLPYLRSSIDQRTALLQGLMDSDGCISKHGNCSFTNSNERIIDATMELLRSLGEVPVKTWVADDRSRTGGYWHVTFTPRHVEPFRLKRKAERVRWHRRGPEWVTIRSIVPVDTVAVRCVAVASTDHLFLAGPGAHTTHNTNVIGDKPLGGQYKKGRNKVNIFPPGTTVSKPQSNLPYQLFEQINRIERQFRLVAAYPVQDDAQSPLSFATGAGLEELQTAVTAEVREYHKVFRYGLQDLDAKRLEWDEKLNPDRRKPMAGVHAGVPFAEHYTPRTHIKGDYKTRRVYGAMAAWDDSAKIVGGIQLLGAKVVDTLTVQENIDGLDDLPQINERILAADAREALLQGLVAAAQNGDPKAHMALIEMLPASELKSTLQKFYTPAEPEMSPEEESFLNGPTGLAALAGGGPGGGAPPDITTVLSRMPAAGGPEGGIQTVARP